MKNKPQKIIYENQEEVHSLILSHLKSILPKEVVKAYLWGSVVERTFGKYEKMYCSHEGSDIDVIVIIDEEYIPSNWKFLNTEKEWWRLYSGGKIRIHNCMHKIELLIVRKGYEDYLENRIKEKNWNVERLK